jgi:hypothetical protein
VRSLDGAKRNPGSFHNAPPVPGFATLHPGYEGDHNTRCEPGIFLNAAVKAQLVASVNAKPINTFDDRRQMSIASLFKQVTRAQRSASRNCFRFSRIARSFAMRIRSTPITESEKVAVPLALIG